MISRSDSKELSICAVYGHTSGEEAIPSLTQAKGFFPNAKVKLLSIECPSNIPKYIEWCQIGRLSYQQYSMFMIYSLWNFVDTSLCLTIQADSFIVDPSQWSEDFLNYDFVGALTPVAVRGNKLYTNFQYLALDNITSPQTSLVLNGGFSLRSMKLMKAFVTAGVYVDNRIFKIDPVLAHEDVILGGLLRIQGETLGLKYAPPEVCKRFSIEYLHEDFLTVSDLNSCFGTHKPYLHYLNDGIIRYRAAGLKIPFEKDYLEAIEAKGFRISII